MALTRRRFIRNTGVGALGFYVAGCQKDLTPGEAREQGAQFRVLTPLEVETLDALGEVLLPGSAEAGLAHFIDHQLGAPPAEQLLMVRYLGVPGPLVDFYRSGLGAANASAALLFDKRLPELANDELTSLVATIASGEVEGWQGPPAGFFYFVLRSDAIDVVYGTRDGFDGLGVPYMAHIEPPSRWGE